MTDTTEIAELVKRLKLQMRHFQLHGHELSAETMRQAADALAAAERVIAGVKAWSPQRCPCDGEKPDPCTLCGATVADGVCKAGVKLPDKLAAQMNAWLARYATGRGR